jgi:hypothetical protein
VVWTLDVEMENIQHTVSMNFYSCNIVEEQPLSNHVLL